MVLSMAAQVLAAGGGAPLMIIPRVRVTAGPCPQIIGGRHAKMTQMMTTAVTGDVLDPETDGVCEEFVQSLSKGSLNVGYSLAGSRNWREPRGGFDQEGGDRRGFDDYHRNSFERERPAFRRSRSSGSYDDEYDGSE